MVFGRVPLGDALLDLKILKIIFLISDFSKLAIRKTFKSVRRKRCRIILRKKKKHVVFFSRKSAPSFLRAEFGRVGSTFNPEPCKRAVPPFHGVFWPCALRESPPQVSEVCRQGPEKKAIIFNRAIRIFRTRAKGF